jgi:hypothetical protein
VRLARSCEAPGSPPLLVFRQSVWPQLILLAVGLILAGVTAGVLLRQAEGRLFAVLACPFFLLALHALWDNARAVFSKDNWLLAVHQGVWAIKFRSYQNRSWRGDEPILILLAPSDIASVGTAADWQVLDGVGEENRSSRGKFHYLELRLKNADTSGLAAALEAEYQRVLPRGRKIVSFSRHAPVSVPRRGVIRLCWLGPYDLLRPGLERAVELLGAALHA